MNLNELSDAFKAKAQSVTSTEELMALAESEGIVLSDDQLEAIAGGSIWNSCEGYDCPDDNALGD